MNSMILCFSCEPGPAQQREPAEYKVEVASTAAALTAGSKNKQRTPKDQGYDVNELRSKLERLKQSARVKQNAALQKRAEIGSRLKQQQQHQQVKLRSAFSSFEARPTQEEDATLDLDVLPRESTLDDGDLTSVFSTISFSSYTAVARDFDVDPTELYLLMQRKKWRSAIRRISEAPEEVSIWVYRTGKDGTKVSWRLLPLHAAIILDAPLQVIEALVTASPESCICKDDEGCLPIHLSCRLGSPVSVLRLLLKTHPKSVDKEDSVGMTPIQILERSNHSNKHAAEDVVRKYLDNSTLEDDGTENTKDSSTAHSNAQDDATCGDQSSLASIGHLRKGRPPKLEHRTMEDEATPDSANSPIKVAFLVSKCSADESSMGGGVGGHETEDAVENNNRNHSNNKREETRAAMLEQIREKRKAEVAEATEKLTENLQKVEEEAEKVLQTKIRWMEEKHLAELEKFQSQPGDFAALADPDNQSNLQLMEFKAKQKGEIETLKDAALVTQELAKRRVTEEFGETFKDIEERYRMQMAALRRSASGESGSTVDWESESQKIFESKFEEMKHKYREDMHDVQVQLNLARQAAAEEHRRDNEQKQHAAQISEMDKRHRRQMCELDQKFEGEIKGIHRTINTVHAEMIASKVDRTNQTKSMNKLLHELEDRVNKRDITASAKTEKMQQTLRELQKALMSNQMYSETLFDHIQELEARLDEHRQRETIMVDEVKKLQDYSMMMCWG